MGKGKITPLNEPLGLPKGSVRAIISLIVIVSMVIAIFVGKEASKYLEPIAALVIGYYFGFRDNKGEK